jgi:O-antigen ligase
MMPDQLTMLVDKQNVSYQLTAARIFALIALCMVPVSTALTNIACGLFALLLLLAPEFWRNLPLLVRQPAAASALLLFVALAASVTYTVASHNQAWAWVAKYDKLLLLPFAVIAFKDSGWGTIVRWSWFLTLCVILLLSITNYFGVTAIGPAHAAGIARAWVFKNHIAAGLFDALLFYQAVDFVFAARRKQARLIFAVIAVLTLVNVLVMLQGRTGQIVTILFVLITALRIARHKHAEPPLHTALYVGGVFMIAGLLVAVAAMMHGDRLVQVCSEVQAYRQSDAATSTGLRLEWYRKSLELIRKRPLIGYGAAGLATEFAKMTAGKAKVAGQLTANPHNEYLLMMVQLGLLGALLFVNLLIQIGRSAITLDARSKHLLLGWTSAFAIGCLANSLLLDFAEGHLLVLLSGILLGCGYREQADVKPVTHAA